MSDLHSSYKYKNRIRNNKYINGKCVCAICGGTNGKVDSIDHFIPVALAKWGKKDRAGAAFKLLNSEYNIFYTHRHCNENKGSMMPTLEDVNRLNVSEDIKDKIIELYMAFKDDIDEFNNIVDEVRKKQKNRCYICARVVSKNFTLRRKLKYKNVDARVKENAIIICRDCNYGGRVREIQKRLYKDKLIEFGGILISKSALALIKAVNADVESNGSEGFTVTDVDVDNLVRR